MINPFVRMYRFFTGATKIVKRAFYAAQKNRLSADWSTSTTSIIQDIRAGAKALRTRARDLAQNNDIAKRYINLVRTNVVGNHGFTLQVKAKKKVGTEIDETTNTHIEEKLADELGLTLKVNETKQPVPSKAETDDTGDDKTDDELDEAKRAAQIKRWFKIKDAAELVIATLGNGHNK